MMDEAGHRALPALTYLNLSSNGIGPQGGLALAAAFRRGAMASLKYLCLSNNPLGDSGLAPLVTPGVLPPTLTHLFPFANQITDEGVAALLKNTVLCKSLETLNLQGNWISDIGLKRLVSAVDSDALPALEQLLVEGNQVSAAAKNAVDMARRHARERVAPVQASAAAGRVEPQFSNSLSFV